MGYFLTTSAFRSVNPSKLAIEIEKYLGSFDVIRSQFSTMETRTQSQWPAYSERTDLCIFPPVGDWTLVQWPEYFIAYDAPTCQSLSQSLNTLVSTIHTFDSDYWAHHVFHRGELLDRFCSWPSYFVGESDDVDQLREAWRGNPEIVATSFGVSPSIIAPYFTHQDIEEEWQGKAHDDDSYSLQDIWVFTDFWKRRVIDSADDHVEKTVVQASFPYH